MLGLAAAGAVAIQKRRAARPRMPHLDLWQRLLATQRGTVGAAMIAARVQAHYDALHADRPHFAQPALRMHLEAILPGLALYQALREDGAAEAEALRIVEPLFAAAYGSVPVAKGIILLHYLPKPFVWLRAVARWYLEHRYPPEGWTIERVADNDECLAFNVYRCFYLDVLTAYGAKALTPLYCGIDELLYRRLPPSITWERTSTLGRGAEHCDFCWRRVAPALEPPRAKAG
jgi:hypothetical protein